CSWLARTAPARCRWPSSSPPRWPTAWRTKRYRCTAATATCASSPWKASSATYGCGRLPPAPRRSCARSSPGDCRSDGLYGRRSQMTIVRCPLLMFTVVALGVASVGAQDVVKLGQIEAQTGPNAIYGWMSSQGTALAVDEINKAGGFSVGGKAYKLQLIALDTRGEPKEATVQLKRLLEVDEGKDGFGSFLSHVLPALQPHAAGVTGELLMWGGATRIHD